MLGLAVVGVVCAGAETDGGGDCCIDNDEVPSVVKPSDAGGVLLATCSRARDSDRPRDNTNARRGT